MARGPPDDGQGTSWPTRACYGLATVSEPDPASSCRTRLLCQLPGDSEQANFFHRSFPAGLQPVAHSRFKASEAGEFTAITGAFMSNGSHLQGTFEPALTQSPIQRLGSVESQQEASKPDYLRD